MTDSGIVVKKKRGLSGALPMMITLFEGGAAEAVSRITGTLGKGIAALTLDDDYQ